MKKIVIVGGYGAVGSIISKELSLKYPDRVVVAGRNFAKAEMLAEQLDKKVVPLQLDVADFSDSHFWNEVGMVIMCLDLEEIRFVEFCVEKGIDYLDITASRHIMKKIETLNAKAAAAQTRIVLSTGLAPGLTNLLARHNLNRMPDADWIDIFVLLGLGEKHGDHAYKWTFDNIHSEYRIFENGTERPVKSFTEAKTSELIGERTFYLFNFSDQHSLIKTTSVAKVTTRLAFDSRFLTRIIGILRSFGLTRWFSSDSVQKILIPVFKTWSPGSDLFAVKTVAGNAKGEMRECSISGYGEGKMTAYVAAEVTRYLLEHPVKPGVVHLDEIVQNIPEFTGKLKSYDPSCEVSLG